MLTPKEVAEHAFVKSTFGGYSMSQVDDFLDVLTGDYTSLYEENAALKRKMKVLADKIEEYRETDDAMRHALLTMQKNADETLKAAEQEKAAILEDAQKESLERKAQLDGEIVDAEQHLSDAKACASDYIASLKELLSAELLRVGELEKQLKVEPAAVPPETAPEQPQEAPAQGAEAPQAAQQEAEPSQSAEAAQAAEPDAPAPAQPEQQKAAPQTDDATVAEEVSEPTRRINFENLQFGKDYEAK